MFGGAAPAPWYVYLPSTGLTAQLNGLLKKNSGTGGIFSGSSSLLSVCQSFTSAHESHPSCHCYDTCSCSSFISSFQRNLQVFIFSMHISISNLYFTCAIEEKNFDVLYLQSDRTSSFFFFFFPWEQNRVEGSLFFAVFFFSSVALGDAWTQLQQMWAPGCQAMSMAGGSEYPSGPSIRPCCGAPCRRPYSE